METAITVRLLRIKEVKLATGLGSSWIYQLVAMGDFPRPVALGPKARAWRSDEIQDWILSRPRVDNTITQGDTACG